jgi:hypothetical protein
VQTRIEGGTTMGNPFFAKSAARDAQMKADRDTNYKVPGALKARVTVFWGTNYTIDKSKMFLDYAEKLLAEHGVGFDVYPGKTRTEKHTIQTPDIVQPGAYGELRDQMAKIYDDQKTGDKRQRLPVLFCQFKDSGEGFTVLTKGMGDPDSASPWLPYVLIGMSSSPDESNLIHEIGHAANQDRQHSPDEGEIMYPSAALVKRSKIDKTQMVRIQRAYFVK